MSSTPLDRFYYWEKNHPTFSFLRQPREGQWHIHTYAQAGNEIRRIASALKAMSFPPQSNIAILSKNCAHWIMADLAIWMAGHVSVPIYPTLSADGVKYVLEHSDTKAIFVGKLDAYAKQRDGIPAGITKISFPYYGPGEGQLWDDLLKKDPLPEDIVPLADNVATLMYSSGTTGTPKGIMLTFGGFDFVGKSLVKNFKINQAESFISYLPLSHIAEKAYVALGALYSGSSISFTESLDKFSQNLQEIEPTLFGGVPRIFAKFQEGVLGKIPQAKLDRLLSIPIVSYFIKKTIRKKMGFSRLKLIVGGAAPIPATMLSWFHSIGVDLREIYGMTENSGYSHGDHGNHVKIGTVGKQWPGIETKLSADGEILVKHAGLMKGYFKDEETTQQVFTADGFLKTGDKGFIDEEGYLTITGRLKDQFKTDKAKFIAPGPIETKMLANKDIDQICVVGMGIPQPIALIVISSLAASKSEQEISESLERTREAVNKTLEDYERIAKMVVLPDPWTIDNGLLTPSLKVKRNEIEKIHLSQYPRWYKMNESVVWEK
jgi:long-chain acyl-CoA synthetase